MGIYLNPGKLLFKEAVSSDIYVDKSGLIEYTNNAIGKEQKLIIKAEAAITAGCGQKPLPFPRLCHSLPRPLIQCGNQLIFVCHRFSSYRSLISDPRARGMENP